MQSFFTIVCRFVCCVSFVASPLFLPGDFLNQAVAQQPPAAQQGNQAQQGNPLGNLIGNGQQGGLQGQSLFGGGQQGGSAQADFDSLIELIQSTVANETWQENGTGEGEIQAFPTGVYADAKGTLRFKTSKVSLDQIPKRPENLEPSDVHKSSTLRYVSLPRLEATIRSRQLQHQPLSAEMLTLAGLQRIRYVFIVPPTDNSPGDLVVAGPAGDWHVQTDGKIVAVETGQPVVRLDDLLVLWRRQQQNRGVAFGVSINPRQTGLAAVQEYVRESNKNPLEPGTRGKWLKGLQASLGTQDVEFFGIASDSHAARVLLVADYHMKLIGMGLAKGVDGVTSYLNTVRLGVDGSLPSMTILRWWFAMEYEPVTTNDDHTVFEIRGLGAKVLSENEMLAARGQRVHTGQSEDLNRRFANSFSENFEAICQKYPLYTELRNVFDLSMTLALVEREGLFARADWQPTLFANADWLPLPQMRVPTEVETIVNHRVIRRKHIIAGISGGVWIDAKKTLTIESTSETLAKVKTAPKRNAGEATWWWD